MSSPYDPDYASIQQKALEEDPTIFDYDSYALNSQKQASEAPKIKRIEGDEPKFLKNLIQSSRQRRVEIEEAKALKAIEEYEGDMDKLKSRKFITSSFFFFFFYVCLIYLCRYKIKLEQGESLLPSNNLEKKEEDLNTLSEFNEKMKETPEDSVSGISETPSSSCMISSSSEFVFSSSSSPVASSVSSMNKLTEDNSTKSALLSLKLSVYGSDMDAERERRKKERENQFKYKAEKRRNSEEMIAAAIQRYWERRNTKFKTLPPTSSKRK
jgi:hypothetical protein